MSCMRNCLNHIWRPGIYLKQCNSCLDPPIMERLDHQYSGPRVLTTVTNHEQQDLMNFLYVETMHRPDTITVVDQTDILCL